MNIGFLSWSNIKRKKNMLEKYSPAIQIVSSIVTTRVLFFSAHFIFHSAGLERVLVAYQSAGACGDWGWDGGWWYRGRESLVKFELIRLLPSLQLIIHWHNTGTLTWYNVDSSQNRKELNTPIDRMNRFEIIVRMAIWFWSILDVCFIFCCAVEKIMTLFYLWSQNHLGSRQEKSIIIKNLFRVHKTWC